MFSTSEVFLPLSSDGSFNASINKPYSRLNTAFVTFCPVLSALQKSAGFQVVNTFVGYGDKAYSRDGLTLQMQIGSTEFPQRPAHGYAECYYRLLRGLGIVASQAHSLAISKQDFDTNSFCFCVDCEKVSTVSSSGLNTQGVETRVSGSFLADGQGNANSGVDRVFFHLHAECFIEIRAGSCTLLT